MKFEIKNRWTGAVMFECELDAEIAGQRYGLKLGFAIKKALASDSDLRGSDLRGSNLRGSNLSGSNLRGSDLRDSDLRDSDLRGSDLSDSNLRDSDLSDSDLSDSDLRGSNLSGSDLRGSNLRGSDLSGSDLSGSNLRDSDLRPVRDDFWAVLSSAPAEVFGLRKALVDGNVDGSTYTGECACLVGTIANVRKCSYENLGILKPNSNRPIERFFCGIKAADTPETSQFSKLAVEWLDEWVSLIKTFPKEEATEA